MIATHRDRRSFADWQAVATMAQYAVTVEWDSSSRSDWCATCNLRNVKLLSGVRQRGDTVVPCRRTSWLIGWLEREDGS